MWKVQLYKFACPEGAAKPAIFLAGSAFIILSDKTTISKAVSGMIALGVNLFCGFDRTHDVYLSFHQHSRPFFSCLQ
jgi:hypothetical protein